MSTTDNHIETLARRAVIAATEFRSVDAATLRGVLLTIADSLENRRDVLLAANAQDLEEARAAGAPRHVLARVEVDSGQITDLARGFRTVADFPSPVESVVNEWVRPNGLQIRQVRVPIGVVGLALESRPRVVADAAALCLKVGNALLVVADAGSRRTSLAFANVIRDAGIPLGLPRDALQIVIADGPQPARDLARATDSVDILIPRGSGAFVADLSRHATVPLLRHLSGDTHLVVDESADLDMALAIAADACFVDPWSCASANTLLLHERIAEAFVWRFAAHPCLKSGEFVLRADRRAAPILDVEPSELSAPEPADRVALRVEVVASVAEAVDRINAHGAHIADTLVTASDASRADFLRRVDSACACVNASPRFANGGEFGMGGDVGFSTDKIHARGPLGLEALTSLRYLLCGKGQVRG